MPFQRNPKYNRLARYKKYKKKLPVKRLKAISQAYYPIDNHVVTWETTAPAGVPAGVTMVPSGTFINLSDIAQGDTYSARTGDAIKPTGLTLCFSITAGAAIAHARVVILQGTTTAGSAPSFVNLFETAIPGNEFQSQFNNDNVIIPKMKSLNMGKQRPIKVLYDKKMYIQAGNAGNELSTRMFYVKVSGKRLKQVTYSGAAGSTVLTQPIYLLFLSDAAASQPLIFYSSSLYFIP